MDLLDLIAHPNVATLATEGHVKMSVTVIKLSAIHPLDVKACLNNFNVLHYNLFFKQVHYRKQKFYIQMDHLHDHRNQP